MKSVFRLFLLFSLFALGGCEYQNSSETLDQSFLKVETISLSAIDSLILKNDLDHADSNGKANYTHFYEGYKPLSKTLLNAASEDSSASRIKVSVRRDSSATRAISYIINVNDNWKFWLDIYGCTDIYCTDTKSIIIHNKNYGYTETLTPEDFQISELGENYDIKEFGTDCKTYVSYFFTLDINTERIKFTMSVQKAYETCDIRLYT